MSSAFQDQIACPSQAFDLKLIVALSFYDRCLCQLAQKLDWQSWLIEYGLLCDSFLWVGLGRTCDLCCNTSIHEIADVLVKKMDGCQISSKRHDWNKHKHTVYTAKTLSSIAWLFQSSYRRSLEQVTVETYQFVPSCVLCLSRPDCLSFTSIWFEADCSFIILWQVMVSLRSEIGLAGSVDWGRFAMLAMWFAPICRSKLG